MSMLLPQKAPRVDGRRLRSERTRLLIMEAYIELLRESPEIPTAAEIATRAGVSTRSVFERFSDLQTLSLATIDHVFMIGVAQAAPRDVDGDRSTRLRSHVETRAGICENWLPLWRVVISNVSRLDALAHRLRFVRELVVKRIELMYQPELAGLPEAERRALVIAVEALIDFESWGRMRELYGLSVEEGCRVWITAIDRLLPATPTAAAP